MNSRLVWLSLFVLSVTEFYGIQSQLVKNHVTSICSTWGTEHFKTFDGDIYQFPGECEYNLVSDCNAVYQEFSVHIKRSNNNGYPTLSYVVVTINNLPFNLSKSGITVNEEPVSTPYLKGGVQVENTPNYLKLQAIVGITVMWNGKDAVMVEVDYDYMNHTCGLCGNFDGVPGNDFIHNGYQNNPIEFGNKQKVHQPNDECEDLYEGNDESTQPFNVSYSCKKFKSFCDQLVSESWNSCTSQINPEPYIQACVQDMCGCNDTSNDFCVCSTLSEFSRQCSHAGGNPPSWRNSEFCAKQCPYNMVYKENGSPCMNTCTNQDSSWLCKDHDMDGCFCPSGTVFDDISKRGCIPQFQCQCKHDKIYESGEVYKQDTEECTCREGSWECKSLNTSKACAVEDGSHVTTFDGKTFAFHGNCFYTLAKVENMAGTNPGFTIQAQLMPCADQELDTCLKTVKFLMDNNKNYVIMFTSDGTAKQNSQTITLPYYSGEISIFRLSSFHILLQTSFGLQIQIQHVPIMQVFIKLDARYLGKTRGLCGNYNRIMSDDIKTRQGIVEGTATTFIDSWKANALCSDSQSRLEDPCSFSVENEQYSKYWCAILLSKNNTFTSCHSVVDPDGYYKRCTYSSCNCEKSEACLCGIFSSYAQACVSKGVFLANWKETVCDKYMKNCPGSQVFSFNHQRCQLTCRSLASKKQSCLSDFSPVDGCTCAEGSYLDDDGNCVPVSKCPCYSNDIYIKPGKAINIKDEHCVCTNGVLRCQFLTPQPSTCDAPKVFFNCSSAAADNLQQCTQTCSNPDKDDCDFSECESGCRCPDGLLDDGKGSCFQKNECPCNHNGRLYAHRSQILNNCNTCICKSGKWACTEKRCPASCIFYGSGHYTTFDQKTYTFQGNCAYTAVKNKCSNKTQAVNFGVVTEKVPCGSTGTTCSKSVRLYLGRNEIKLFKGKYQEQDVGSGAEVKYKIRRVGLYLLIESSIGVAVVWDRKTTVRILLEPNHLGEVCGLCGNYDGDAQNDFTTQNHMLVSSPLEFGNSWKVSSSCPNTETTENACEASPNRHQWSKMMCSIITGNSFKDCHKTVDPSPFYENCVKDSCACDSGGDCECFCTAVATYAQACSEAGVCIAWRTPEICPVFCDYYNHRDACEWHYNPCHTPCFKTCLNPKGDCFNPIPNLEGCFPVCPEEKPFLDERSHTCVKLCSATTTITPLITVNATSLTTPIPSPTTTTIEQQTSTTIVTLPTITISTTPQIEPTTATTVSISTTELTTTTTIFTSSATESISASTVYISTAKSTNTPETITAILTTTAAEPTPPTEIITTFSTTTPTETTSTLFTSTPFEITTTTETLPIISTTTPTESITTTETTTTLISTPLQLTTTTETPTTISTTTTTESVTTTETTTTLSTTPVEITTTTETPTTTSTESITTTATRTILISTPVQLTTPVEITTTTETPTISGSTPIELKTTTETTTTLSTTPIEITTTETLPIISTTATIESITTTETTTTLSTPVEITTTTETLPIISTTATTESVTTTETTYTLSTTPVEITTTTETPTTPSTEFITTTETRITLISTPVQLTTTTETPTTISTTTTTESVTTNETTTTLSTTPVEIIITTEIPTNTPIESITTTEATTTLFTTPVEITTTTETPTISGSTPIESITTTETTTTLSTTPVEITTSTETPTTTSTESITTTETKITLISTPVQLTTTTETPTTISTTSTIESVTTNETTTTLSLPVEIIITTEIPTITPIESITTTEATTTLFTTPVEITTSTENPTISGSTPIELITTTETTTTLSTTPIEITTTETLPIISTTATIESITTTETTTTLSTPVEITTTTETLPIISTTATTESVTTTETTYTLSTTPVEITTTTETPTTPSTEFITTTETRITLISTPVQLTTTTETPTTISTTTTTESVTTNETTTTLSTTPVEIIITTEIPTNTPIESITTTEATTTLFTTPVEITTTTETPTISGSTPIESITTTETTTTLSTTPVEITTSTETPTTTSTESITTTETKITLISTPVQLTTTTETPTTISTTSTIESVTTNETTTTLSLPVEIIITTEIPTITPIESITTTEATTTLFTTPVEITTSTENPTISGSTPIELITTTETTTTLSTTPIEITTTETLPIISTTATIESITTTETTTTLSTPVEITTTTETLPIISTTATTESVTTTETTYTLSTTPVEITTTTETPTTPSTESITTTETRITLLSTPVQLTTTTETPTTISTTTTTESVTTNETTTILSTTPVEITTTTEILTTSPTESITTTETRTRLISTPVQLTTTTETPTTITTATTESVTTTETTTTINSTPIELTTTTETPIKISTTVTSESITTTETPTKLSTTPVEITSTTETPTTISTTTPTETPTTISTTTNTEISTTISTTITVSPITTEPPTTTSSNTSTESATAFTTISISAAESTPTTEGPTTAIATQTELTTFETLATFSQDELTNSTETPTTIIATTLLGITPTTVVTSTLPTALPAETTTESTTIPTNATTVLVTTIEATSQFTTLSTSPIQSTAISTLITGSTLPPTETPTTSVTPTPTTRSTSSSVTSLTPTETVSPATLSISASAEYTATDSSALTEAPSVSPIPTLPSTNCPAWGVVQNETFYFCNCTVATCIGNNTLGILPYECPPMNKITCTNGMKPALVWDEFHCCQQYVCDCACDGWAGSHYNTFDGSYYSFRGNCTYVLMEEITPTFNLKIYIDGASCEANVKVGSCSQSIIVMYGSLVVRLKSIKIDGASKLEALANKKSLRLPFSQQGLVIINSGINLLLEIPRLDVFIKFGRACFTVVLPFQYFGRNTQGHCGTCTNNQADDCMLPGGQLINSCAVMAEFWPVTGSGKSNCTKPLAPPTNSPQPTTKPTPCREDSVCDLLISRQGPFAECHDFVSARNFHSSCVSDSCNKVDPAVECESLESYAASCAQAGVCIDWRNYTKLCGSDCPSNKVYKPCGPAEQPTCEENSIVLTMSVITEGCFCPEGTKLFNAQSELCVKVCGCLDPENNPREFNEQFEYRCQDCICEKSKAVTCTPKVCPKPVTLRCAKPGFVLVKQTNPLKPCCLDHVCECQITTCPLPKVSCSVGFRPVLSVPDGKCCPEYTCVPKRVCVHQEVEYEPGSSVPGNECDECLCTTTTDLSTGGLLKILCTPRPCISSCELGFEYVRRSSDKCCGRCVQTHCVIMESGSKHFLIEGESWSPNRNRCEIYICARTGDILSTLRTTLPCPRLDESNCLPHTIQTAANGCCKTCVEKEKGCKLVSMKTKLSLKGCWSIQEVDMPFCEGSCNTFTKYSQTNETMQHSCSCCKEIRSSKRTVKLHCLNGNKFFHSYMRVEECGCDQTDCTKVSATSTRRRRSLSLI